MIAVLYFNRMSDKIQRLIQKEEKQYKKSYKNLNTFLSKYSDEELSKLRSTNFNEYMRHRRLIKSIEKIKNNKNVSQAWIQLLKNTKHPRLVYW